MDNNNNNLELSEENFGVTYSNPGTYSQLSYDIFARNRDKNIFEEEVDNAILEKYSSVEQRIKIKSSPLYKKRLYTLALLDTDKGLWKKLYSRIYGNKMPKIDQIEETILMLREFVKTGEIEKKKFGEVMTPLSLVKEMLATLPNELWRNPYLKWLDPANGSGPFPIMVIHKLMRTLKDYKDDKLDLTDENVRYKHIIENMIYTVDIQAKNVFLWLCACDPSDEYKTNVYWGSFLDDEGFDKHMKEVWELDKFDIILGNPPYQTPLASGDNKLYLDFSKKSLSILNINKYLLFITPKNIIDYLLRCNKNRTYFDNFYQINFIALDTPKVHFTGIGSTFTYFLLKKSDYKSETILEFFENDKIRRSKLFLTEGYIIPKSPSVKNLSIIKKVMSFNEKFDFKVMIINRKEFRIRKKQIESGVVSKVIGSGYKFPIIDGINKSNPFPGKLFYTKENYSDGKSKIILNKSGYLCPSFDKYGEYSLSDNLMYLEDKNEYNYSNFMRIINSKLMNYWLEQFRLNGFSDHKNIKKFPILDLDTEWTDEMLYKHFDLTPDEIGFIEEN